MSFELNSVVSICREWKVEVNRLEAIPGEQKSDIQYLRDLVLLRELTDNFQTINFQKLPLKAIGLLHSMAEDYEKTPAYDLSVVLMIDALSKGSFEGESKNKVKEFVNYLDSIYQKYLKLSPEILSRYREVEKVESGPLHKRALQALEKVEQELIRKLSARVKKDLQTRSPEELIKERCLLGVVVEEVKVPPPSLKSSSRWHWGAKLASGYGEEVGKFKRGEKGVLARGGARTAVDLSSRVVLQADYDFSIPYDVSGQDDLVANKDFGRISLRTDGERFDLFAQAGWRYERTDYPSAKLPNLNVFVQSLRINYQISGFHLILDEHILAGWVNDASLAERRNYFEILFQPGLAYRMGRFNIFGGASAGYPRNYGGFLGMGLELPNQEIDLRLDYLDQSTYSVNLREKVGGTARYVYDGKNWQAGLRVNYESSGFWGGEIFARLKIAKGVELLPFVGGVGGHGKGEAHGGVMLLFGDLRTPEPTFVRPYLLNSLSEEEYGN